jgi:hypothetical protein
VTGRNSGTSANSSSKRRRVTSRTAGSLDPAERSTNGAWKVTVSEFLRSASATALKSAREKRSSARASKTISGLRPLQMK